jgi:putative Mn2+ efflux pump MntP
MGLLEIIIIAIGLSMDAFAVSVTLGLSVEKPTIKHFVIPALFFGFFQGIMPLIGFFVGLKFASSIQNLDHWIAFVLLAFIGGKMIKESFSKEEEKVNNNSFRFFRMLILAIATSIDALAVGVTFAFFEVNILKAIFLIGVTTFLISICGVKIGNIFGSKYKSKAEFAGGVILILIGAKILIEHLFFM